jgi:hypothetical protein
VAESGRLDLDSGQVASPSWPFYNWGAIRMGATGPAIIRAPGIANFSSATILGRGSLQGAVENAGAIAFSGDSSFTGDVTNDPGGEILVTGNSTTTFFEDFDNDGAYFYVDEGSRVIVFGAYTAGAGNQGPGDVYAYGDLRPGASPGVAVFGGDLYLGPLAELEIELCGLTRGDEYDVVAVAESLALNGTLDIVLDEGFIPERGDSFDILDWGARQGNFREVHLPSLPGELLWDDSQLYASGVLRVTSPMLEADFDEDGDVDGNDLAAWRGGYGVVDDAGHTQGDADGDRDTDGGDFLVWQRQFGSNASLEVDAAVAEPGGAMLAAMAGGLALTMSRCRYRACAGASR